MIPAIEVRVLMAKHIAEGTLSFAYEPEEGLMDLPGTKLAAVPQADLVFRISEDGEVDVRGTLRFTLEGECMRCLAPAKAEVSGTVEGTFVEGKGDGIDYGYSGGVVKLDELMRDSFLFALPSVLLCGGCAQETEK